MSQTIYEPSEALPRDRDDRVIGIINYVLLILGNVTGITSIIAVILAYARREDATHWMTSHYTYQIRTFWIALVGVVICAILTVTIVGAPLAGLLGLALWVWVLVRSAAGLVKLAQGEAVADPHGFWI
ncbi:DUF4870 family protein [Maricaulis sp. D1M11]|uniref:DUF4870 family protein n=1 Tax=Maricaulis sp. D1M11 TaxID=3076117 RepID=UPI0039B42075